MGLLKDYQVEIETLSRRCRTSESAFQSLQTGLSQSSHLYHSGPVMNTDEVDALRSEIKDLENELGTMKNQDVRVRQLEGRLKELDSQKKAELTIIENDWSRKFQESEARFAVASDRLNEIIEAKSSQLSNLEVEITQYKRSREMEREKANQMVLSKQDEINNLIQQIETLQVKASSSSSSESTLTAYKELIQRSESRIKVLEIDLESVRNNLSSESARFMAEKSTLIEEASVLRTQSAKKDQLLGAVQSALADRGVMTANTALGDGLVSFFTKIDSDATSAKEANAKLTEANGRLLSEIEIKSNEIRSLRESQGSRKALTEETITIAPTNGTDDVVSIIQAQRDRFRQRVLDLEGERDNLKQTQFELHNRINVLVGENRKVETEKNFWKTQSVEQKVRSPGDIELGSFSSNNAPNLSSLRKRVGSSGDMEQTVTSILVWGLSNPIVRRAGLLYLVTLHLLVFFVLYRLSSILSSSSQ
jgi:chromosome segregation ATPase